jgi:4-hydroxy-tetrahydrodipicolinate synthase
MRFEGTYTALVTPFSPTEGQPIDWEAFDAVVADQLAGGITGLVPCGTTGESPTLTHEEHVAVIKRTVARAKGKAQIIAGTGSNATRTAIDLSREAEASGVDAVMVVVPYYNKPTQEGLYRHFVAVARSVKCPMVIYNIPGRSAVDLSADTLSRIAKDAPNVVATKEATGNVLTVLSGDDALTLAMIAVGARGVISVTSNVLPGAVTQATALALAGNAKAALAAHQRLLPLHEIMFVEANPAPAKAALAHRGIIRDGVRGPLAEASESARAAVIATLKAYEGHGA